MVSGMFNVDAQIDNGHHKLTMVTGFLKGNRPHGPTPNRPFNLKSCAQIMQRKTSTIEIQLMR